jgi:hypothetical protein
LDSSQIEKFVSRKGAKGAKKLTGFIFSQTTGYKRFVLSRIDATNGLTQKRQGREGKEPDW